MVFNRSIRTRLHATTALNVAALAFACLCILAGHAELKARYRLLVDLHTQRMKAVALGDMVSTTTLMLKDILYFGDDSGIAQLLAKSEDLQSAFSAFKDVAEQHSIREDQTLVIEAEPTIYALRNDVVKCVGLIRKGQLQEAQSYWSEVMRGRTKPIQDLVDTCVRAEDLHIETHTSELAQFQKIITWVTLAILAGSVALAAGLNTRIAGTITKPLSKLVQATDLAATGDLTARVDVTRSDEVGHLAASFNHMLDARAQAEEERERLVALLSQSNGDLEQLNQQLKRSNSDLQDFAYVASHDLQEPLRKVQAFGDRLKTKHSDGLGEQGEDYLNRMQDAAGRMKVLINDLLTYSRVSTKAQPFVEVDLGSVIQEVLSDLEVRIEQLGARIEVSDLPTIDADPLQIRQLLQNLIGNALKFHRDGETPVVKIDAEILDGPQAASTGLAHRGDLCRITVQDNGIGFDEKYAERIFGVFQRLHGRGAYEGTGVGLAVCRKIVERHKGEMTAASTPGEGAMFIVTLPVRQTKGETVQ